MLDIDGPEGAKSLVALQDEHGKLPDTVVSATGSGGYHLFYRAPPGQPVPNSASKLGPKLDVRGDGGYVIAPPSVHPNATPYAFLPGCEPWSMQVAPAPDWLLDLVVARPVVCVTQPIILPATDSQRDAYVTGALRRAVEHIARAPEGCRNNTLNTEAISLTRFILAGALSVVELSATLTTAALAVGLGLRETKLTIASALRAGLAGQGG